jgi:hypothetical protein
MVASKMGQDFATVKWMRVPLLKDCMLRCALELQAAVGVACE